MRVDWLPAVVDLQWKNRAVACVECLYKRSGLGWRSSIERVRVASPIQSGVVTSTLDPVIRGLAGKDVRLRPLVKRVPHKPLPNGSKQPTHVSDLPKLMITFSILSRASSPCLLYTSPSPRD